MENSSKIITLEITNISEGIYSYVMVDSVSKKSYSDTVLADSSSSALSNCLELVGETINNKDLKIYIIIV